MKFLIIIFTLTIIFTSAYTRDTTRIPSIETHQKYVRKSDNQRVISVAMFATSIVSGAIVFPKTNSLDDALNALSLSVITGITGIILYIASIRNRKKARLLTADFTWEKRTDALRRDYENYVPSVSVRLSF